MKAIELKPQSEFISQQASTTVAKPKQTDLQRRRAKLRDVAQQFEAIFITYMLKTMRQSIPTGGLFNEGLADDIYKSMFDSKLGEQLAKRNQLGLADIISRQLSGKLRVDESNFTEQTITEASIKSIFNNLKEFEPIIQKAAERFQLSPNLIRSIIYQESGGNPHTVSSKGAKGLMQLMDETAKELGVVNVFDPEENIFGGVKYLRQLLDGYNGDVQLALASYNAGPRNVERYRGIPPFKETQHYVRRVLDLFEKLQQKEVVKI